MYFFSQGTGLALWALLLTTVLIGLGLTVYNSTRRAWTGQVIVPGLLMAAALFFFAVTFDFPREQAGPAMIPRLWITCLLSLCTALLYLTVRGRADKDPKAGRIGFVLLGIGCMTAYFFAIEILGYFISSFLFLAAMMYLLSYRKPLMILLISTGWLLFSYVVFYKLLYIQLPLGLLENYL